MKCRWKCESCRICISLIINFKVQWNYNFKVSSSGNIQLVNNFICTWLRLIKTCSLFWVLTEMSLLVKSRNHLRVQVYVKTIGTTWLKIGSIRSASVQFLYCSTFFAFSIAFQTFLDFHSNFFFYKCSWNSFSNLPSNPNYSGMKSLQSTEMSLCTQHLRPKRPFSCERYYVLIRLLWDFPKSSFSQNFS